VLLIEGEIAVLGAGRQAEPVGGGAAPPPATPDYASTACRLGVLVDDDASIRAMASASNTLSPQPGHS